MILNSLGMAYLESGDVDAAVDHHQRALARLIETGDEHGVAAARSSLAWARLRQDQPASAVTDLNMALDIYRGAGRTRNVAIALRGLAFALAALGRFDEALAHAEEAAILAQLPLDRTMAANCLAWTHFGAGHLRQARQHYQSAAELAQECSGYEWARATTGLGNVAARVGDRPAAERYWSQADVHPGTLDPAVLGEARTRTSLQA